VRQTIPRQLQRITRPDRDPIFRHYGAELIPDEYLDGHELSVELWLDGGEPVLGEVHVRTCASPPGELR
jgi:hypothetical protein